VSIKERREREKKQRKKTILIAAMNVLNESGFTGLSMDKVAEKSELSKGAIYLYFASKEELIIEIFWMKMKQLAENINKILERNEPLEKILTEYITLALNFYTHEEELFKLMLSAFTSVPHDVMQELRKSINSVTNQQKDVFVKFFLKFEGQFKYEPVELFLILRGMITSLLMAKFFGSYEKDIESDMILDVFLKGVLK